MDPAFGHWLAGFLDGEGHFGVWRVKRPGQKITYGCMLRINLRADDAGILEEIAVQVGYGKIASHSVSKADRPQIMWTVASKPGCRRMIEILDEYPMRAKKARDYAIWREAVLTWGEARNLGTGNGSNAAIWARMAELKAAMELGRAWATA